jgi:hypothetical protein
VSRSTPAGRVDALLRGETAHLADKVRQGDWVYFLKQGSLGHSAPDALNARPAPEGEVLEVTVTVTDKAKLRDSFLAQFARWDGRVYATDYIEYDLMVAPGSPLKGFYHTPFKGNNDQVTVHFKRGEGVDQFGREQIAGPEPKSGAGVWEHRVIEMSSYGPGIAPGHGIMFKGVKPGTYKVYLDNLRIRHADGKTTPIWTGGKDTKTAKVQENELFKGLKIQTVKAADVGK